MYYVSITYHSPKILHKVHNDIKNLSFILGEYYYFNLDDARSFAIKYINETFAVLSDKPLPYILTVPIKPDSKSEWDAMPLGPFCCEQPFRWKINAYFKHRIKGFIFDSFHIEKLFHINIIQVHKTCRNSPSKVWYSPNLLRDISNNNMVLSDDDTVEV